MYNCVSLWLSLALSGFIWFSLMICLQGPCWAHSAATVFLHIIQVWWRCHQWGTTADERTRENWATYSSNGCWSFIIFQNCWQPPHEFSDFKNSRKLLTAFILPPELKVRQMKKSRKQMAGEFYSSGCIEFGINAMFDKCTCKEAVHTGCHSKSFQISVNQPCPAFKH